ncbi:MAG: helix-turn-helix domain-containing protein [Chitinophagales bacterium]|nr:helix-turn-helix domain-containing protein [Chitinophagales bacterium]
MQLPGSEVFYLIELLMEPNKTTNKELELAYQYVCFTNKCIFLTGKAGTGKTTFLHRLKDTPPKRLAVVAPTGVAAINAGGQTIHSLFQLPFGPFSPGNARESARQRRFTKRKIKLIRSLDLLIIDEISMVRADLLDGIDDVLRRYRHSSQAFGGVQLLMIGDLHQLPPVVKDHDWDLLREHYETPYFFSSHALQKTEPITLQLKHIYRQSDVDFIALLNRVRNNQMDDEVLSQLNSRYVPADKIQDDESYITLTTHNATAQSINQKKLAVLPGKTIKYEAVVDGDFPPHSYPAEQELEIKVGAQVMFIKNDLTPDKRYYNGKIGKVIKINKEEVLVQCPGDESPIDVLPAEWSNRKYKLNESSKEIEEEVIGTFVQYPLRLAWAITIHKSQGLTFEKVILDAEAAFAHGQVYVALSRCKSFEGIILRSKITYSSVRTDNKVRHFSKVAEENAPNEAQLNIAKTAFQQSQIVDLFDFSAFRKYMDRMRRVLMEYESSLLPGAMEPFKELDKIVEEVYPVERKFLFQLQRYFQQEGLPERNEALQERIGKAANWFYVQLTDAVKTTANKINIVTDNQKVKGLAEEALENLQKELFTKQLCLRMAQKGFSSKDYLRLKADADIDFKKSPVRRTAKEPGVRTGPSTSAHPELLRILTKWRSELSKEEGLPMYRILPTKTLWGIAESLPVGRGSLESIDGIGPSRLKKYGEELIEMVLDYCDANGVEPGKDIPYQETIPLSKPPKPDTKQITYELYQQGKSIEEIAEERSLTTATIEGHLSHFIEQRTIDVTDFLPIEDVQAIIKYAGEMKEVRLSEIKAHFEDTYTYGQLKMALAYQLSLKVEEE